MVHIVDKPVRSPTNDCTFDENSFESSFERDSSLACNYQAQSLVPTCHHDNSVRTTKEQEPEGLFSKKGRVRTVINSGFVIDEDDYRVVQELLRCNKEKINIHQIDLAAPIIAQVDDDEHRVYKLGMISGQQRSLTHHLKSLPPSIGQLCNLKELDLGLTMLSNLPEEIGDLRNLNTLLLNCSCIASLPSSIGRLHNLRNLDLARTIWLTNLPEEIGNLKNLNQLILNSSRITSLPSSIGKLQKLQTLDLGRTIQLSELPDEIGNLKNLKILLLNDSHIMSLPPSIGQLQNLQELDLYRARCNLQDEIGNLKSLHRLILAESPIKSLPSSIGQLYNLKELDIRWTFWLSKLPKEIENLKNLDKFLLNDSHITSLSSSTKTKLRYKAALSNARFRTQFWKSKNCSSQTTQKTLPLLLHRATHAFQRKFDGEVPALRALPMQKPDAIYQLLLDFREPFIQILLDRTTHSSGSDSSNH